VAPRRLVGGYFIPEDGGSIFLRNVVPSYKSTRKHNPEVHHLHRSKNYLTFHSFDEQLMFSYMPSELTKILNKVFNFVIIRKNICDTLRDNTCSI